MKRLFSLLLILAFFKGVDAQKMYTTNSGQVKLKSTSKVENFNAENNKAESRWLENNGQLFFSVVLKDFIFENEMTQSDFMELFTENGKFPKAEFKGFIQDIQHIDLTNSGGNEISIEGSLNIHGVTQKILVNGNLTVLSSGKIMMKCDLKVKWKDFNVSLKDKASKSVQETVISIYCIYE
jgi:hypothetical protein